MVESEHSTKGIPVLPGVFRHLINGGRIRLVFAWGTVPSRTVVHHAQTMDWCHDHRTCWVCQSFVQAKQQIFKGIQPRLARVLDAG